MSQNKITAVHAGTGVWDFTCYAHPEITADKEHEGGMLVLRAVSSPRHALELMRGHCDKSHPGVRMRMSRDSDWSGAWRGSYTGKEERKS